MIKYSDRVTLAVLFRKRTLTPTKGGEYPADSIYNVISWLYMLELLDENKVKQYLKAMKEVMK